MDLDALRAAFERGRGKTKVFIHNTPHNPTGAVFTREETEAVAAMCEEFDVVVLADEVYERCTFGEDVEVTRMANVAGMRNRTLTVGTSSKLLCLSGWRVGWMTGPPGLIGGIRMMHSYATFCAPTPLQLGVAAALERIADQADTATRSRARAAAEAVHEAASEGAEGGHATGESAVTDGDGTEGRGTRAAAAAAIALGGALTPDSTASVMANNAEVLGAALREVGLRVFKPRGGYFLVADVSPLGGGEAGALTSVEYCRRLAHGPAKVAAVPLDVFYDPAAPSPCPSTYVRFAVCKKPETIAACAAAIRAHPVQ